MDLTSLGEIKKLLRKYRTSPSKGLGQNFLIDKLTLKKVIAAADLRKEDVVLEIGPGIGTLTLELAKRVKNVIAVEKDPKMCAILRDLLKDLNVKNCELIRGDILELDLKTGGNYKLVANLPYYITAPVIRKFLEAKNPPKSMVLMIQKEVAQRICAKPPKMSILAVSVQFYASPPHQKFGVGASPKIISFIPKNSFWPRPKVDGAIIKITPNYQLQKSNDRLFFVSGEEKDLFFKIVKAGFSQPRKQLVNSLSKGLKLDKVKVESWLKSCDIRPDQRAETLSLNNWILLTKKFVL